ncbi:MAG: PKD domain-containing protein, partial [Rhodothermales bacterium]|nr:PKD domain-containing protein [Rhodothermales bacterium]
MTRFTFLALALFLTAEAAAQPVSVPRKLRATVLTAEGRMDARTGHPRVLFGTDYRAAAGTPLDMARSFLVDRAAALGLEGVDLEHTSTLATPGGSRVRFRQVLGGTPVFGTDVVVSLGHDGKVAFLTNNAEPGLAPPPAARSAGMSADAATERAGAYLGAQAEARVIRAESVYFVRDGRAIPAQQVDMAGGGVPGDWRVVVDAESGDILMAENRSPGRRPGAVGDARPRTEVKSSVEIEARSLKAAKGVVEVSAPGARATRSFNRAAVRRVDASGWVFDPDPLSRAQATYGGEFVDADDTDSQALTDQLVEVTLRDVSFDGTTYLLEGPYARVSDVEGPFDGVFSQTNPSFHYTRGDSSFEATNIYHHLDQSLRYINETLGFSLKPYQYDAGLLYDPHGWDGDDQSSYSPSEGLLSFGEGGVDDGEDVDVILHELGHGLHDWLTNGGLSQVDGLSEGVGDYWANSYHRSLGFWDSSQEERAWIFHWDGHNEFFNGRTAAYGATYPDGLIDQIHTDGQIWASSVMEIWEELGRETTDLLFLEALSMTGSTSSQSDAALAFMSADSLLNGAANIDVIREVFQRRGYLIRANFAATARAGEGPLSVLFFDASFVAGGSPSSWAWDFDDDGVTDATGASAQWSFTNPGLYTVSLTIEADGVQSTLRLEDFISVNSGIYLWQGGRQQFDRSGDYMRNHFLVRQLQNAYSNSATVHSPLAGYQAVFLSLGSFDTRATRLDEGMASTLRQYIQQGGQVFLDGSEALGFDQADSESFLALFGLSGSDDGLSTQTPVQNLTGVSGAITEGLQFSSSSQAGTTWIDVYTPEPPAVAAFVEAGLGTVAVQNERTDGGKTFAMSYALGHLDDGTSSRAELLDRVLEWFGFSLPTDTESAGLPGAFELGAPFPNPVSGTLSVNYTLPLPAVISLDVFDTLGRR